MFYPSFAGQRWTRYLFADSILVLGRVGRFDLKLRAETLNPTPLGVRAWWEQELKGKIDCELNAWGLAV